MVSACLGFAAVRYSGEVIPDKVVAALREHVDFLPVCPEVEIGLGVPRPVVRLVRGEGGPRMLQPRTGEDLTERMAHFGEAFLQGLGEVEGFLLKNRSPSCALKDAKVYAHPEGGGVVGKGPGLFARLVEERFPLLPKEDEGRLTNPRIRGHFFTRVFALARLRRVEDLPGLMAFHARYKLLLMAYSQKEAMDLGRLLAGAKGRPFPEVRRAYEEEFLRATERLWRLGTMTDALLHAFGHFKKALTPREKAHFLDLLMDFREERLPLEAPLALLASWARRFAEPTWRPRPSWSRTPGPDARSRGLEEPGEDPAQGLRTGQATSVSGPPAGPGGGVRCPTTPGPRGKGSSLGQNLGEGTPAFPSRRGRRGGAGPGGGGPGPPVPTPPPPGPQDLEGRVGLFGREEEGEVPVAVRPRPPLGAGPEEEGGLDLGEAKEDLAGPDLLGFHAL